MRGLKKLTILVAALLFATGCNAVSMGARVPSGTISARDAEARAWKCEDHFGPGCAEVTRVVDHDCGDLEPRACVQSRAMLHDAQAKAICDEGSLAECVAACSSGTPRTCQRLAKIYRDGERTPRDAAGADRILRGACARGGMEECVDVAGPESGIDPPMFSSAPAAPAEAAALAMRACVSDSDYSATNEGCTLWMATLEAHGYAPADDERRAGLARVCAREGTGDVGPDTVMPTGDTLAQYHAAACGQLKDMGTAP